MQLCYNTKNLVGDGAGTRDLALLFLGAVQAFKTLGLETVSSLAEQLLAGQIREAHERRQPLRIVGFGSKAFYGHTIEAADYTGLRSRTNA